MGRREIHCPKCGEIVKVPYLWVLGLEMIFYCRKCRNPFRINYKWGALLAGTGWALALVSLQLIAFFTSKFTVVLAAVAFVPLGILYSFGLRRAALRRVCKRRRRR